MTYFTPFNISASAEYKNTLRKRLLAKRDAISEDERAAADVAIAQRILSLPEFSCAETVFSYLSFGTEVNTHNIIAQALRAGKNVALPRCVPSEKRMTWHLVDGFDGLKASSFGMLEPDPRKHFEINPTALGGGQSVALVPGLGFDREGYRLGYGGGYYDRFLGIYNGIAVGLARGAALMEGLEFRESHDIPVSIVVTESLVAVV